MNAVALHGAGTPISVPDPTRYALYKLLVVQKRAAIPRSQAKAEKNLGHAWTLVEVLARQPSGDLEDLWHDLRARGPSWRRKTDRSLLRLKPEVRPLMEVMTVEV